MRQCFSLFISEYLVIPITYFSFYFLFFFVNFPNAPHRLHQHSHQCHIRQYRLAIFLFYYFSTPFIYIFNRLFIIQRVQLNQKDKVLIALMSAALIVKEYSPDKFQTISNFAVRSKFCFLPLLANFQAFNWLTLPPVANHFKAVSGVDPLPQAVFWTKSTSLLHAVFHEVSLTIKCFPPSPPDPRQ